MRSWSNTKLNPRYIYVQDLGFVLASYSVPVNYDYTRLNVETRTIIMEEHDDNTNVDDKNNALSSDARNEVRFFWDGNLLANIKANYPRS